MTIPDGVTTLSYSAFQGNQTVVSVVIPNSVTEIQSYAFMDCPCLEEVTLPNNLQKTDSFVFDQSPKLKKVIFAEGTQEINVSQNFFYGCAVEEVVLPESVKKIGDYAFSEIAALKEINLPDSITEIGTEAFRKCSGLTNIKLPEGLTALGGRAFAECENLAEIYIPAHLTDVGGYIEDENGNASYSSPFYGCAALRTVYFSEDLAEIPPALFADSNVAEITIPETVTTIGKHSFSVSLQVLVPGDTNKDAEVNLFDSYKIVDYAMKALRLNNTALKTDESQLVQNISLGELAKGIEQIRGIQLDIFDLKENGLSAVSTAGSAKTDFVNSVYSTEGDYVRMIAADYERYSSFTDSTLTVRYSCDSQKRLQGRLYIQTDSETLVKDVEFVFDGQEQNPEAEFSGKAVIDVSYLSDGQEVDPEKLEAGSAFQIQVTVKNTASEVLPGNVYFTISETLDGLPQKLCTIQESPWCNGDINNSSQVRNLIIPIQTSRTQSLELLRKIQILTNPELHRKNLKPPMKNHPKLYPARKRKLLPMGKIVHLQIKILLLQEIKQILSLLFFYSPYPWPQYSYA